MKYCGMTRPSDQNDRVCHLHFDKSSFGNSVSPNQRKQLRLRPNAMPELHIPNIPVPGNVLQSVQDFLILLDIKPLMHLLEMGTFSLNNVIGRLTKIMNRANKNWAHL